MPSFRSSGPRFTLLSLLALSFASGCGPQTATTAGKPPQAATKGDPFAPQASLVAPDDPNATALNSAVRKVTIFSDRAMVTREAGAELTTSATVYAFRNLPGWVDEGSVRVATTAGRIVDLRVSRTYLAQATEASYRRAEEDARQLEDRLAALDDELKVLAAQAKQVDDIKAFSLEKLNKDVVVGNVGVSTYSQAVEFIAKTLRQIAKGRREVAYQRERLTPQVAAAKKRLEDLKALTQVESTTVYVTLQGTAPASARVALSYMLPGATWEPLHELRTSDDADSVELTSFAVVTQASGEDWDNAELTFSTQSSTATSRIPELEALTLGSPHVTTHSTQRQSASFSRAESAFKDQNRLWNLRVQSAGQSAKFEETYQTNFEYLQVVQSKTIEIFQSLQQRGTTAQFKAATTTKVRADGRSVRVPIGRTVLKAKRAIVAAPEQSLNAAQTLEMRNESGQPLLPGNVALYQGGAFLGMTTLEFVADGEQFAVFLSLVDQLKLSRVLDKKRSALVRKQRTQMQLAFIITAENLSTKPITLQLADRIPVSEDKDIVVNGVVITPTTKPDSKGIVRWPITLQPKEKRRFDVQYQLEYPPTLVLDWRRNRTVEPAPSPAHPAPRKAYNLKDDIQRMEDAF